MYKLLLTFRYLRRKLIPVFAMLAVVLCTAMVIIVISVMGGFLDLVRNAGRTLMGDVSMRAGLGGFPHYERVIEEIEALPEAEAATPVIVTYGLLKLPYDIVETVQVYGIEGPSQDRVTAYRDTLYWTPERFRAESWLADEPADVDPIDAAVNMRVPWEEAGEIPALVPGIELSPFNRRRSDGTYAMSPSILGMRLALTTAPITRAGDVAEPDTRQFVVVNEFNSGVYDVDKTRVFIPFDVAQEMMHMDAAARVLRDDQGNIRFGPDGVPMTAGEEPARATEVHIRAAPGVSADQLRDAVTALYDRLARADRELPPRPSMSIVTWEQSQAQFLAAVENEKGLMTVLFGIISITAVVMVGVVFYMIVLEKTHDIGILRSIGASKAGVASIFLSFAAVVGVIGSAIGTLLAYLIVTYINEIHAWLGDGLGMFAFTVGVPVGAMLLCVILAVGQVVIRSIFELRRGTMLAVMPGLGAALGLLVPISRAIWALGDRAAALSAGEWAGLTAAAAGGGAVLFLLVAAIYTAIDANTARRTPAKVLSLAGVAGAVAAVFVGVTLATAAFVETLNERISVQIWDRSVYFFDRIPNRIDFFEVGLIVVVAIVASVIGALIPAIRAALVDPVESLRYE